MANHEELEIEKEAIYSLDSYIVLQYIKSSVDIILNLKFEEIEKRLVENHPSKLQSGRSLEDEFKKSHFSSIHSSTLHSDKECP